MANQRHPNQGSPAEKADRERIINAARLIYGRGGPDYLKRRTIAEEAGVTPNIVSKNFRTRATLIDRLRHAD